jgi:hypothetical protein
MATMSIEGHTVRLIALLESLKTGTPSINGHISRLARLRRKLQEEYTTGPLLNKSTKCAGQVTSLIALLTQVTIAKVKDKPTLHTESKIRCGQLIQTLIDISIHE